MSSSRSHREGRVQGLSGAPGWFRYAMRPWGNHTGYDGFGNLLTQAPKSGYPDASPNVLLTVNAANNRISSTNWIYDGNGNTTRMPVVGGGYAEMVYDVDNRLRTWTNSGNVEEYGYLADNKRVWKKSPAGAETYYLYGVGGQRLMTCSIVASPFSLSCSMTHVYFGRKVIRADGDPVVNDRLGSVVARGNAYGSGVVTKRDHFPYGDEIGGATSGNLDKFGTYTRDATTGLDYADQRYYAGTLGGRFLTADPSDVNQSRRYSGSFNRFAYSNSDPVLKSDPTGLGDPKHGDPEDRDSGCYWEQDSATLRCPEEYVPMWPSPPPGGGGDGQSGAGGGGGGDYGQSGQPPASNSTSPFTSLLTAFYSATSFIKTMQVTEGCQNTLNSIMNLETSDSVTLSGIRTQASLVKVVDGTTSTHPISAVGATVEDIFRNNPDQYALAHIPGTVIYMRPGYETSVSTSEFRAAVLHEMLHGMGFRDLDIQTGLGLVGRPGFHASKTDDITQELKKQCFEN